LFLIISTRSRWDDICKALDTILKEEGAVCVPAFIKLIQMLYGGSYREVYDRVHYVIKKYGYQIVDMWDDKYVV